MSPHSAHIPWTLLNERTLKAICRDLGLDYPESKSEVAALLREIEVHGLNYVLNRNASASSSGLKPPSPSRMPTRSHNRRNVATSSNASSKTLAPYVEVPPLPHPKTQKLAFDGVLVPPTPYSRRRVRRVFDGVEMTSSRVTTKSHSSERRKAETGFIGVVIPIYKQSRKRSRPSSQGRI